LQAFLFLQCQNKSFKTVLNVDKTGNQKISGIQKAMDDPIAIRCLNVPVLSGGHE